MGTTNQLISTTTNNASYDPYLKQTLMNLVGSATNEANQAYTPYTGARVAGLSDDEIAAYNLIRNGSMSEMPLYQQAGDVYNQGLSQLNRVAGQQTWTPEAATQYMNPYIQNVVNTTTSDAVRNNQQQLNALRANQKMSGAFGGSRGAIAETEMLNNNNNTLQSTLANLYNTGYTNAQTQFNSDRDYGANLVGMYGQAASGLTGLAGAQSAYRAGQAQDLSSIGQTQRGLAQTSLDTAYQDFQNQQNWNKGQLSYLSSILSGNPLSNASTGTTQAVTNTLPTNSTAQNVLGSITTGLGLASNLSNAFSGIFGNSTKKARGGLVETKKYARGGLTEAEINNLLAMQSYAVNNRINSNLSKAEQAQLEYLRANYPDYSGVNIPTDVDNSIFSPRGIQREQSGPIRGALVNDRSIGRQAGRLDLTSLYEATQPDRVVEAINNYTADSPDDTNLQHYLKAAQRFAGTAVGGGLSALTHAGSNIVNSARDYLNSPYQGGDTASTPTNVVPTPPQEPPVASPVNLDQHNYDYEGLANLINIANSGDTIGTPQQEYSAPVVTPKESGPATTLADLFTTPEPSFAEQALSPNPLLMMGLGMMGANAKNNPYDTWSNMASAASDALTKYEQISQGNDTSLLNRQRAIVEAANAAANNKLQARGQDIQSRGQDINAQLQREQFASADRRAQLAAQVNAAKLTSRGVMTESQYFTALSSLTKALNEMEPTPENAAQRKVLSDNLEMLQRRMQMGLVTPDGSNGSDMEIEFGNNQ